MYKKLLKPFIWCCLLCCFTPNLYGQYFSHQINLSDSTQVHILRTVRGDRFVGKVKDIRSTTLFFALNNGDELSFNFQEVISVITWLEDNIDGRKDWHRHFNQGLRVIGEERSIGAENLIYSSTAFNYGEGGGEVRSFAFVVNVADVGLSENISVGGGFALPDIGILRFKATTSINNTLHIGAGTNLIFPISDIADIEGVAHAYAVLTKGTRDRYFNITAGAFIGLDSFSEDIFVASIGGGYRVAPQWRLHFEILFGAEEVSFLPAVGVLWQKGKFKLEFGLAGLPETDIDSALIPIFALGFIF